MLHFTHHFTAIHVRSSTPSRLPCLWHCRPATLSHRSRCWIGFLAVPAQTSQSRKTILDQCQLLAVDMSNTHAVIRKIWGRCIMEINSSRINFPINVLYFCVNHVGSTVCDDGKVHSLEFRHI